MAKRIKIKQILELRDAHMSQNMIATSRKMSKTSVGQVCRIADEKQIRFDDVRDMTVDELYQLFFPDKSTNLSQMYELPDYVHKELKRVGVNLKLLWTANSASTVSEFR